MARATVWVLLTLLVLGLCAMSESDQAVFDANKERPEVTTTASGLQYEFLSRGSQSSGVPTRQDQVTVHYHGQLMNGETFDSSYARQSPATFGLTQVISGWTEMLQLMQTGDKVKAYLPPHLAYGSRGAGGAIPPNAALQFTIELLAIPSRKEEL